MATLDELLKSVSDDEEETEEEEEETNNPLRKLRNLNRKLKKELKLAVEELKELRQFKAERESEDQKRGVGEIMSKLGLTEKQAELFLAVRKDEEPTMETVRAFAEEYGFPIKESEGEEEKPASTGFTPTPKSEPPSSSHKVYEVNEWQELYKTNPQDALRIAREGRVKTGSKL